MSTHNEPQDSASASSDAGGSTDAVAAADLRARLSRRFGHAVSVPAGTSGLASLRRMAGPASHRDWSTQPVADDHLDGFFNTVVDASMVMMNFIQAAAAAGLVRCPTSMLRNHPAARGRGAGAAGARGARGWVVPGVCRHRRPRRDPGRMSAPINTSRRNAPIGAPSCAVRDST